MKQKTPKMNAVPAVPATLSKHGLQKLSFYTILLTVIAPLIDSLAIFPLRQIILANSSGTGVIYQIFYQITELFNLLAFFLLLSLAIYCAIAGAPHLLGRIIALHGIASVFIVILLRMGIYYLLAWIDSNFYPPFALCNQTLSVLTKNDGAELLKLTLGLFLSQVLLFALLFIVALIALRGRQKALTAKSDLSPRALSKTFDQSPLPRLLKATLILYTAQALLNQVISTVMDLINLGIPNTFGSLTDLIVPYFFLAIYCILGYLALDYSARYIARQADI